jgi:hypothetical protein
MCLSKYFDDPKHNAAFDRCVDVMVKMMLKYGPDLLQKWSECSNSDSEKQKANISIICDIESAEKEYSTAA